MTAPHTLLALGFSVSILVVLLLHVRWTPITTGIAGIVLLVLSRIVRVGENDGGIHDDRTNETTVRNDSTEDTDETPDVEEFFDQFEAGEGNGIDYGEMVDLDDTDSP